MMHEWLKWADNFYITNYTTKCIWDKCFITIWKEKKANILNGYNDKNLGKKIEVDKNWIEHHNLCGGNLYEQ